MVEQECSIQVAAASLNLRLTKEELVRVSQREEFKVFLRAERNKLRRKVAQDPSQGKDALIGAMLLAIEGLIQECEWEKVVSACEKLAKVQGIIGVESNINVFAGMTATDIKNEKDRILKEIESSKQPSQSPNSN